jgi:cell wall-associated NlpC family hydrolase
MEKTHWRPWLAGAATLALTMLPTAAFAATDIHTLLDGKELTFPVAPVIEQDRTLVPARGLIEALGGTIGWDGPTGTVSAAVGSTTIKAVIGSETAQVNGAAVPLQVPPKIIDGSTLIPLRFFVENLGLTVTWNGETRTIAIDTRHSSDSVVSRDGSGAANRQGAAIVAAATKLIGTPYAWGGTSPDTGFDCSGFVWYLAKQAGVELPRTSEEMFTVGIKVTKDSLLPGDLVFFTTYAPGASHVGIYDGKGGFIQAQSAETGVKVTPLSNPWWVERYLGARRVFR